MSQISKKKVLDSISIKPIFRKSFINHNFLLLNCSVPISVGITCVFQIPRSYNQGVMQMRFYAFSETIINFLKHESKLFN